MKEKGTTKTAVSAGADVGEIKAQLEDFVIMVAIAMLVLTGKGKGGAVVK